jgi:hypothetical protein
MRLKVMFTEHPATVGETYWEHACHSAKFGVAMLLGAFAAFVHAVCPAICTATGSRIIGRLHDRMILSRSRCGTSKPAADSLAEHI